VSRTIVARWEDWTAEGREHLVLEEAPASVTAESVIVGSANGVIFGARYRIVCDGKWRVRRLEVSLVGGREGLQLVSDGTGRWTSRSDTPRPDLANAIDVDLSATPFTNTLPIRRLDLASGRSETIRVVYVELPGLAVTAARQRYTCLEPGRRYRFESLDADFTREIDVDANGLVVTYPGLFRRLR
jgi:hypothetical protein